MIGPICKRLRVGPIPFADEPTIMDPETMTCPVCKTPLQRVDADTGFAGAAGSVPTMGYRFTCPGCGAKWQQTEGNLEAIEGRKRPAAPADHANDGVDRDGWP